MKGETVQVFGKKPNKSKPN